MLLEPILINRPIDITPLGTRLCQPPEAVVDILPKPQHGAFTKENREVVIDADHFRQPDVGAAKLYAQWL